MTRICSALCAMLFSFFASANDQVEWYQPPEGLLLRVGSSIPTVRLKDSDDKQWSTGDFRGKVTVVTFFTVNCGPCMKEIPALNDFKERNPDVRVVAISPDDAETSRKVREQHGMKWPILSNANETLEAWGVLAFPSFVLISEKGVVLSATYGNRLTGTSELGYVTSDGIAKWLETFVPDV